MKDYYITLESMFLVVKLYFHPSIGYPNFVILLPWTTYQQHQNYSQPKTFQNFKLPFSQLSIHIITLYKMKGVFQGHKHLLKILIKKETNQKIS